MRYSPSRVPWSPSRHLLAASALLSLSLGAPIGPTTATTPSPDDEVPMKRPPAARLPAGAHVAGQSGVTIPMVALSSRPRYPLAAMREEIEGEIELLLRIGVTGTVDTVEILSSSSPGHGFEAAAQAAVSMWEYRPALLNGKPVEVYTVVTVDFVPESVRDDRRWAERQQGLRSFAESQLYADAPHLVDQDGVSAPVLLKKRDPENRSFPSAARMRGVESRVLLLIEVTKEGRVGEVPLVHAERPGNDFEAAAEQAVRGWRYAPALREGKPVDVWHWVEIAFTLSP